MVVNKEIKTKTNDILKMYNSNKNIFMKKEENNKKDSVIYLNNLKEKNSLKRNDLSENTSVKKVKQIKKISIIDNDNKCLLIKKENTRNERNMQMKRQKTMKHGQKLDSSNKENHRINNKEKNEIKKNIQNNVLQNIVNATKKKIKQNLPNKIDKNISNKYSTNLNNSQHILRIDIIKNKDEEKQVNNKSLIQNNINLLEKKEDNNHLMNISHNKSIIIENSKNEEKIIVEDNDKDKKNYSMEYITNSNKRKNMSDQKIILGCEGNIIPIIKMKKEHIKYSIKKNSKNTSIDIKNKKLIYEDDNECIKDTNIKKYNSMNNEIDASKSYISMINNYDIINIINKKERTKKLSSSNKNDSSIMNNTFFSKKKINKNNYNSNIQMFKKINLSTKFNNINKEKEKEKRKEKESVPITMRNNSAINDNILLQTDKISPISINNNIFNQNKWDKKYFIPIVSASLINGEEKNKNNNFKKVNNKDINLNDVNKGKYRNNHKKSLNFGDNNKKKREMLFNFSNKKLKNKFFNINKKRTKSFIYKRNKHISERNNSVNNLYNDISLDDLNQKEQKLELILKAFHKEKMCKFNNYSISMDKITDNNQQNNINNHKKQKTVHLKVNSLNVIKSNNNNHNYDNIIVKRGDLLNKLRDFKHNISEIEK